MVKPARQNPGWVVGAAGFEPAYGGTKSRCLTAWRRPNRGRTLVPASHTGKSLIGQFTRIIRGAVVARGRENTLAEETTRRYTPHRWFRSVAQLGRALSSGGRGREFESRHSDQSNQWLTIFPRIGCNDIRNVSRRFCPHFVHMRPALRRNRPRISERAASPVRGSNSPDHPEFCSYCRWRADKLMREWRTIDVGSPIQRLRSMISAASL
jgi:hypothetical protein